MDLLLSFLAVVISLAIWPGSDPFELPKLIAASILLCMAVLCRLGYGLKKPLSPQRLGIEGFEVVADASVDSETKHHLAFSFLAVLIASLVSVIANGFSKSTWLGSEAGADGLLSISLGMLTTLLVAGNNKKSILLTWLTGCTIAALYGIIQRLGLDPVLWQGDNLTALTYRVFGTLGNPSFLAMLLSMAIPIGLILTSELQARKRALAVAATLIIAFTLPLTMSRVGIISGMVGIAGVWIWSKTRQHPIMIATSLSLLIGMMASGIRAPESATGRFADLSDPTRGSVAVRVELYKAGIEAAMAKPLFGWGPGNTTKALRQSENATLTDAQKNNPSVHNLFLDALVQRGILGLFATIWFWIAAAQVICASREPLVRVGIGFGGVAFLLNSMVGFTTVGPWLSICLLLGLATASIDAEPVAVRREPR